MGSEMKSAFLFLLVSVVCAQDLPPLPVGRGLTNAPAVTVVPAGVGPREVIRWEGWRPGQQWQVAVNVGGRPPVLVSTNRICAGTVLSKMPDGLYELTVKPVRRDGTFGAAATMVLLWTDEEPLPVTRLRVEGE